MKSLRLLVTTECNYKCAYCCNKLPAVKTKFTKKRLEEIDFSQYADICITGGEPFLYPNLVKNLVKWLLPKHNVYIYSNGSIANYLHVKELFSCGLKGLNIGIHPSQPLSLYQLFKFGGIGSIVFYIEDIYKEQWDNWNMGLDISEARAVKWWHRDDCFNNTDSEDWVLLANPPTRR